MGAAPHLLETARSDDFEDRFVEGPRKSPPIRVGGVREAILANAIVAYCWAMSRIFPSRFWYGIALRSADLVVRAGRLVPGRASDSMEASHLARMLHRFLDIFATLGNFPIPLVIEGEEILRSYAENPAGFICCSAHLPFVKTFFPLARKAVGNSRERWVISRTPELNNVVEIWNDEPWKAIFADNAVLLKVRATLRRNACLVAIIDKDQGDVVSANIFRFAGKVNCRVLTWFTELQENGTILVRIAEPPSPQCKTEEEIAANLSYVERNVERILRGRAGETRRTAAERAIEAESLRDQHRVQLYSTKQLKHRIERLETLLSTQSIPAERDPSFEQRLALLKSELKHRAYAEQRGTP